MSRIEVGGGGPGGGVGGGTSSALSTTKLAYLTANLGGGLALVAGSSVVVGFLGGTVVQGEDYFGDPGSALPLAATAVSTDIHLPFDDCQYDLDYTVALSCDPADAGQMVGFLFVHSTGRQSTYWAPVKPNGSVAASIGVADQAFDDRAYVTFVAHAEALTVDATVTAASVLITKR